MLLAQQPQRISSSFALCRDAHLRNGWPHSLFKEMFIFFSFTIKTKIYSLRKKLENSERLSKEKLKYALSQHQVKNHCFWMGIFGLKMCIWHVFLLWLHLECFKVCAMKRNQFKEWEPCCWVNTTDLFFIFLLSGVRLYKKRALLHVVYCSIC